MDDSYHVRPAEGWYILSVLCVLYALSYTDRSILSVVSPDVIRALDLSPAQFGLVAGAAFAFMYAAVGIPAAHYMDNGHRARGLAAGVAIWSISTVGAAFAAGFWSLLATRAGVAVGEAVLTPAAVSILADAFPPHRRTAPMTAYSAVGAVMGMGGILAGGLVFSLARDVAPAFAWEPWRVAMILLGLPGIALAALVLGSVRELPRITVARTNDDREGSISALLAHLRSNFGFYAPFYLGAAMGAPFPLSLMIWGPGILVKEYGLDQAAAASRMGAVGVVFSVIGTIFWPILVRLLCRRWSDRGFMITMAVAATTLTAAALMLISSSVWIVTVGMAIAMGSLSAWSVVPALVVQRVVPGRMRARMIALHLLFISLAGFGLGPLVTVLFANILAGGQLGLGLAAMGFVFPPAALACYCAAALKIRREEQNEADPKAWRALETPNTQRFR